MTWVTESHLAGRAPRHGAVPPWRPEVTEDDEEWAEDLRAAFDGVPLAPWSLHLAAGGHVGELEAPPIRARPALRSPVAANGGGMSTVPARTRLGPAYSRRVRDLRRTGLLRGAVVGLLLGTALLTGCAEKQEARDTLPTASAAPTTEALPELGPADFPVPDEARTKDAAGAEAFPRYWIDLLNRQRAIPDGQPIRDLGPECRDCLRIAKNYDEAAAAGHRYVGGELSLNELTEPLLNGDEASITFGARTDAVRSWTMQRAIRVEAIPTSARTLGSGIALAWSEIDQIWLVTGLNLG